MQETSLSHPVPWYNYNLHCKNKKINDCCNHRIVTLVAGDNGYELYKAVYAKFLYVPCQQSLFEVDESHYYVKFMWSRITKLLTT